MRIFVNDKPMDLIGFEDLNPKKKFDAIFSDSEELPPASQWQEDILFQEPSHDLIIKILYQLRTRKLKDLDSVTLVSRNKDELKK
nr:NUDIX hydrolase [Algoriphagus sp.]